MHSWGYVSEAMSIRYGKTKRLLKALATTARVLLLMSALSACLLFWIWTAQPGLVDRADNAIFGSYQKSFQSEYRKAIEHLERSETDESGRVLGRMLSRMGDVRTQDRLASTYVAVRKALIEVSGRQGRQQEMLEHSEALVRFDSRNHLLWLDHAIHLEEAGLHEKALEAFYAALRIAPHSEKVAAPLAEALQRAGRTDEARGVVAAHMASSRSAYIEFQFGAISDSSPGKAVFQAVTLPAKSKPFWVPFRDRPIDRVVIAISGVENVELKLDSAQVVTAEGRTEVLGLSEIMAEGALPAGERMFRITDRPAYIGLDLPSEQALSPTGMEIWMSFRPVVPQSLRRFISSAPAGL